MSMKVYIKRELVKAFPAFNIDGEIYAEDDPDIPTITKPQQIGYGVLPVKGGVEWESEEDFELNYIPYETQKEHLIYLRDVIKREIDDVQFKLKLSQDNVDLSLMRIERAALITCYEILEERISRIK